jgi:hypothetical protein
VAQLNHRAIAEVKLSDEESVLLGRISETELTDLSDKALDVGQKYCHMLTRQHDRLINSNYSAADPTPTCELARYIQVEGVATVAYACGKTACHGGNAEVYAAEQLIKSVDRESARAAQFEETYPTEIEKAS